MNRASRWWSFALSSLFVFASFATSNARAFEGDLVYCAPSSANTLSGLYSLDFLLTDEGGWGETVPGEWAAKQSFFLYLTKILLERGANEMQKGVQEYYSLLFQEGDFAQPRVWQKASFGLPEEKIDESTLKLPPNCGERSGGKITLRNAIHRKIGGEFVLYEYDANTLAQLRKDAPLQWSFVIVHSWLEDYEVSAESKALLSRALHSVGIQGTTAAEFQRFLVKLGFKSSTPTGGVCSRSVGVASELERRAKKDCSRIAKQDLASVRELSIDWTEFKDYNFRPDDFADLTGLERLEISGGANRPLSVPPEEIRELRKLRVLRLFNNGSNRIPSNFLSSLSGLEEVDLSGNEFAQIYRDTFAGVFVQKETGKPVKLSLASNLKKDYSLFEHNYTYLVPGCFNGTEYVTELDLSLAHLDRFQASVFDPLVRLEKLDLSKNLIRDLALVLKNPSLSRLKWLDLSGNPFKKLREQAFDELVSLEELRIEESALEQVPEFISRLKSLKRLRLCNPKWSTEEASQALKRFREQRPDLSVSICGAEN